MNRRVLGSAVFALFLLSPSQILADSSIETLQNGNGEAFTARIFNVPAILIDPMVLSIAERYHEATAWGGAIPNIDTNLTCEITDEGSIDRQTCEAESWRDKEQLLAMMLVARSPGLTLPRFPAIDRAGLGFAPRGPNPLWSKLVAYRSDGIPSGPPPFYRLAKVAMHIQETRMPIVDLGSGPLVEFSEIAFQSAKGPRTSQYPSRALREGREGAVSFECQVQSDNSIICRELAFEPAEIAPYFTGAINNMFWQAVTQDRLKNGQSAVGARFRSRLRWQKPE